MVVTAHAIADIRSPMGLTGPLDLATPLWTADFLQDQVVSTTAGSLICSLPDVGISGLARVGGGKLVTLHDGVLFAIDPGDDCGSSRLRSVDEGHDLAWDGTDLLHLQRTWLLHRDPTNGGERRQRTLSGQPMGATKMAVMEGRLYLVGARPHDDGGFVAGAAVYDLASAQPNTTPVSTFDVAVDASNITGVHASASPARLWLLTAGSGEHAGMLIEVELSD
jgi:hypothetical protein